MVENGRLAKKLTLFDVYVVSAAAMFSSGFFLLPGIAAAEAGRAVVLAYLLSGLLVVPAMLSKAELATAMPKAGGTYYYLDRTLGPLVGTVGGFGTWLTLMLKSAFALIGMGAYLQIFFNVHIVRVAVAFTLVFALLNVVGARQSTGLLRVLVVTLMSILSVLLLYGLYQSVFAPAGNVVSSDPGAFMQGGIDSLLGTVGLVFISYIGLTKVASVAEEVQNPDRNIPLGMALALGSVMAIYVLGVYLMVTLLGVETLAESLTPVADMAGRFTGVVPPRFWVGLTVVAATAAFISMSNAGILAASRYPLAMARDRIIPDSFAVIGRFNTPVVGIAVTGLGIVLILLTLDVVELAKLAGAMQLAIFALVNIAVIVMRESKIEAYDPGFRSPLYPWLQLFGIIVPFVLVAELGWLPSLFTLGVIAVGVAWFHYYARDRIEREGAIFHVFARLGRRRFSGLDRELRDLMKERGVRAEDPFDEVVARARVLDLDDPTPLSDTVQRASGLLEDRVSVPADQLSQSVMRAVRMGGTPVARGAALVHTRFSNLESTEMVLIRCATCISVEGEDPDLQKQAAETPIQAMFLVVSGVKDPGQHLRILAQLAGRIDTPGFLNEWLGNANDQELKETLLRDDRFLALKLHSDTPAERLVGHALRDLQMPEGCLVALIRRAGITVVPRGRTVLREGDRLTIIGEPQGLAELKRRYVRVPIG